VAQSDREAQRWLFLGGQTRAYRRTAAGDYTDMLRVAFTSEFKRGKLADLVALLSGRNFETKQFEESIAEASFAGLKQGVLNFINETHFKRFAQGFGI